MNLRDNLQKYFGYDTFRNIQEKIVEDALLNKNQLIVLPTGSGKSICYQLPSLLSDKLTIIISPLKSLIKDQISNLKKKNLESVGFYGDSKLKEKEFIIQNMLKDSRKFNMIYTTPETLISNILFIENLDNLYKNNKIGRFVIDEAHCISLWGNDFRSSYKELNFLKIKYPNVPFMFLTATATPKVKKDIMFIMKIKDFESYTISYYRSNLNIIVNKRNSNKETTKKIEDLIKNKYHDKSGIIYCQSRKKCDNLKELLLGKGIICDTYHAGMTTKNRNLSQENWKKSQIKIIIATIAFGMGVDKNDVRYIIHFNMPSSIENYYQEIGRGGRDGIDCDCYLYYSYQDKVIMEKMLRQNKQGIKNEKYINYQITKLNTMINYCENITDCRHCQISNYLGDKMKENCLKKCNNCLNNANISKLDITLTANTLFNIIMQLNSNSSKTTIKNQFKKSTNYYDLLKKFKTQKKVFEIFQRILIFLIINKYIKEVLERTEYGFWIEKYKLFNKCKDIMVKKEKIFIPICKSDLN